MAKDTDLPDWLRAAIETACSSFELGAPGNIGWSVLFGRDGWEAWIYPTEVEMVGGDRDGEHLLPGLHAVRLSEIVELFDEPPDLSWFLCSAEITEVSIEGHVQGHDVWLHIMEEPPEDAGATAKFDVNSGTLQDLEPRDDD